MIEGKILLTREEAEKIAKKLERSMKLRNQIEFASSKQKAPKINFHPDTDEFFDSSKREIHIGWEGLRTRFETTSEEDFQRALEFVQGHESQHVLSTTEKSYGFACRRGVEVVLEYIASVEDPGKRFRLTKDYEKYVEELGTRGIYINWKIVSELVAGLANSLEDGRIENIRARKYMGFKALRVYYRGMIWRQSGGDTFIEYEKMNPAEKLRVICNQVLTLSTCQLYEPGFYMAYAGTPLIEIIRSLMNHIAKAVISPSCKGMGEECIEICRKLAPLMYEAFKISKEEVEARKALEELLKDLAKAAIEDMLSAGCAPTGNEETGDGEMDSVFGGGSDLEITLSDEEFDKLEKDGKLSKGIGGIKVKREHPKKSPSEKSDDSKKDGSGSSSRDGETEGTGEGEEAEGTGKEETESSGSGGSAGSDDTGDTGEDKSSDHSGKGKSSDSEFKESSGGDVSGMDDFDTKGEGSLDTSTEDFERKEPVDKDELTKKVEEAMKKAADETIERAKETIDTINTDNVHEKRRAAKTEVVDTSEPIDAEHLKDVLKGHGFLELKRAYKVEERMPAVLEARCRAMYRKNKRYFKSLSTPNVSHLDSGSVDPSLIYGLGFGDTEIFRKIGKDKKFDGCAYILLDNSGSMAGDKRIESAKAAAVIEEGFKGIMPIKIVAFDDDYSGTVIHEVIKGWDESLRYNCCYNYALHGRQGRGNNDGYDIEIATKELLQRPEKNKLLCVLSDGEPDPGTPSHVKEAVKKARKRGIEVYSIYFEKGSVGYASSLFKDMYEKDFVCCELGELDEQLSKLFKKFSRR